MRWITSRNLVVLSSLVIGILGCGGTEFPYKYYGIDAKSYEGKLLGPTAKQDLPFAKCKPDDAQKGKCVLMLVDEFEMFRFDYMRCKETLKEAQK